MTGLSQRETTSKKNLIGLNFDFNSLFENGAGFLKELDVYLESLLFQNEDLVILFEGYEGTGKSKVMRVVAQYCISRLNEWGANLPPLSVDNIHFDLKDYINKAEEMNKQRVKGWVNILDESRKVANRKNSMSRETVAFTNYLSECRSSCQIHFIGLPSYHDIDSYIAIWRQKFIISLEKKYKKDEESKSGMRLHRGYFKIFADQRQITYCYYHKVKYMKPKNIAFQGKFSDALGWLDPIYQEEYEKKKEEFREKKYAESDPDVTPHEAKKSDKYKKAVIEMYKLIRNNSELTQKQISEITHIDIKTFRLWMNKEGIKA
jgi:hypothetical protein